MGFWISALHNECDRSAHLEREIERLRAEITELQTQLRDTYKERDYWEWASRGD